MKSSEKEYQVIARKYRPQNFDEVVGQNPIAQTLKNAILSKRVAHAYLFCGTRGVGKTSTARILAKSLNCLSVSAPTTNPCQTCDACLGIAQGEDVDVIEIDGASNRGIDEIRNIQKEVGLKPSRSRFKIYIIDEVHMLTIQAFNALLKILEEPPAHVKFFFATTQAYDVPETIHSRCQRFDFKRVAEKDISFRLQQICEEEKITFDEEVLKRVATIATGGMRDSQSILDQLISSTQDQKVTIKALEELMGWVKQDELREIITYFSDGEAHRALIKLNQIYERGNDLGDFVEQLILKFRALMLFSYTEDANLTDESQEWLESITKKVSKDFSLYGVQLLIETQNKMKQYLQPRILLEMTFIKLAQTAQMLPLNEMLKKTQALELKLLEKIGPLPTPVVMPPILRTEDIGLSSAPPQESTSTTSEKSEATAKENKSSQPSSTPASAAEESKSDTNNETSSEKEATSEKKVVEKVPEVDFQIPTVETLVSDFKLKELWPQIVERVKAKKAAVGYFLSEGQFLNCDDMRILVGFPPLFSFHREQLESEEKKQYIIQEVKEVTQQTFEVKFIEIEEAPEQKTKRKLTDTDLIEHRDVQKITQFFNGRVLKIDK